jgi:hypothetical protein
MITNNILVEMYKFRLHREALGMVMHSYTDEYENHKEGIGRNLKDEGLGPTERTRAAFDKMHHDIDEGLFRQKYINRLVGLLGPDALKAYKDGKTSDVSKYAMYLSSLVNDNELHAQLRDIWRGRYD